MSCLKQNNKNNISIARVRIRRKDTNIADFILTGMKNSRFRYPLLCVPISGGFWSVVSGCQAIFFPFADDAPSGGKEGNMYFDAKEFGKRVAALRNEENLSQDKLAEELNMGRVHLGKIESGMRTPSIDLMIDIAEYFNVSLDYLILGKSKSINADIKKCQTVLQQAIGILSSLSSL